MRRAQLVCLLGVLVVTLSALGGCASVQQPIGAELKQTCKDPRPEVCTMQYAPVCAFVKNPAGGNPLRKQYSNACGACADGSVTGYISGPCPSGR